MNNQEPKSRMQRYDFNTGDNKGPNKPRKTPRLRQIIIGFIVALVLVVGVGVWLANRSTSVENKDPESSEVVSDSNDESDSQDSNDNDDSSDDTDTTSAGDVNGDPANGGNTQTTPTPKGSNRESNATTRNSGQSQRSSNSNTSQSGNGTGNTSSSTPSENNNSGAENGPDFTNPPAFKSVDDAKSWAQATRSDWLKQGYKNYTITQDPQGDYILTFTK